MMNFFGETRTNLLPLLRGKLDPIDLFFPKGSFKVALAAYKDNIVSKCTNRVVVEDMLVLVKHFTKISTKAVQDIRNWSWCRWSEYRFN